MEKRSENGIKIGGAGQNPWGWFADLPPNESLNSRHQVGVTPCELPREGWAREYDNKHVVELREYLQQHNGIPGLEICDPHEVERAVALFHRDGFVAVRSALTTELLDEMKATTDRAIMQCIESTPPPELRYSIGGSSASRQWFHDEAYLKLIDLPTTTPILTGIFGSSDYIVGGCGGDCALPGAIEYQSLHTDSIWEEPHDPRGDLLTLKEYPVPVVTINFNMCDVNAINGAMRVVPGTQHSRAPIPSMADEPAWMKLSTVQPAPAGTAVFRDNRLWHGGTPNLSHMPRAIPNVEYFAPWFRSSYVTRSMPHQCFETLSPHGRHIARMVKAPKGEVVLGAGFVSGDPAARDRFKARQLEQVLGDGVRPADWQQMVATGKLAAHRLPKL